MTLANRDPVECQCDDGDRDNDGPIDRQGRQPFAELSLFILPASYAEEPGGLSVD